MLENEQYKLIAVNESVALISKGSGEMLAVPLVDMSNIFPINLCKTSFTLGWAAAKAAKPDQSLPNFK